ncbi:carboxylesterase from carbohydrate esterase [Exidia glandulosa HHB12029]|uniref:Carboxylic ester hydrolase n=1 Tax=Exidia glandulosa HHB12029 TaxID=1314781 RepID=A0A165EY88_EXIGL|nr:carboxylesterase from carbohydrate esterase [Exidia glandulosa HHB12029]
MGVRYGNTPQRFTYSTVFSGPEKTFNNTVKGSQCVQASGGGSEDCLFLNIFTPFIPSASTKKSELRPVLFHIHGGAFTSGNANDGTFDGGAFSSRGDIVVVDINYRLSTLGFLALDDGVTNGNFGISDQVTALNWVRANIAAFGGDPDRITIVGQSAGASSVRILMASPEAIGKFSAAIPMSNLAGLNFATIFSNYLTIAQEVQQSAIPILALTGCNTTTSNAERLACLRAFDAQKLVTLSTTVRTPVVDGKFITSGQLPVDGSAPVAHVPVLMGIMRDDGAAFIGFPTNTNITQQIGSIISTVPATNIMASGLFDPPSGPNATLNVFNVTARITTDIEFRCLDHASVFSSVKRKLFPNLWFYQFDRSYQTPGFNPNFPTCDPPVDDAHPLGDTTKEYFHCHSGELYYTWGTLGQFSLPFRDGLDLPFSQFVQDHWTAFAHTHDPNPDPALLIARGYTATLQQLARTGRWEPVTTRNLRMKIFDTPARFEAFQESKQCDFLNFPLDFYEN